MRAAVGRILPVDKGVKSFAEAAVTVGETKLQRLLRIMERRIDRLAVVCLQIFHHQVQQSVAGLERLAVEDQLQAGVEVTIMPQPSFHVFRLEEDLFENGRVRLEANEGAVWFIGHFPFLLILELALLERGFDKFSFAKTADQKVLRQSVDGLGPDAVQADAELEHVVIVFGPGVNLRDAIDDFAQRNAASEIAH